MRVQHCTTCGLAALSDWMMLAGGNGVAGFGDKYIVWLTETLAATTVTLMLSHAANFIRNSVESALISSER